MEQPESADGPPVEALRAVFDVHEVRSDGRRRIYYGESLVPEQMLVREIWPSFRGAGYDVQAQVGDLGQTDVVIVEPASQGVEGIPWKNIALFALTVLSTLFVGAYAWYYIPLSDIVANPLVLLRAWPFTAAVLGVLSVHELGHYAVGRYHGVNVSLPYLIPFIFPFGTLGAIIRMRGQMPDRKTLFDIGVAGPLAGLAATVVVTVIGLSLEPMTVPSRVLAGSGDVIVFNNPPLLDAIATVLGRPTEYADPRTVVHPVVIGGWVGMFFTVLNLLPVGQLDGGHMVRAMLGERQESLAAAVPLVLFGIAGYLHYVRGLGLNQSVGLWFFWGLMSTFIAYNGPAKPIDETPLGPARMAVGLFTFALGAACFLLVPVQVIPG
ncbi:S2P family metalloprotease [Haloferax gibbonsii ATCC 33959]|uniref:S2P family metalloprotease n=1 Tax=Haloferax gibbonsii (strain ATCC 33959 / DSM 4427 / JCM 8863 / NBRC 102184 / NCIMB 2188 / Ma 2.38) TaxID=1227459 RepID=M0H455_HALGM|nr:site-2 protease family protein [Haloferax gibbonsii]ELZ79311.1 S2P family metalloprotease [Haloferax gibbonsii ATCC 33959]